MAKKKEKQIPAKQQMYEQIITKQLYGAQPSREEGIAHIQEDYNNWKQRQDGIAKLQSDYDNWLKAQQPAETPKVETPKVETQKAEVPKVEAPKVEAPKVETPKIEATVQKTPAQKSQTTAKKVIPEIKEEKKYLTHADMIPSLNKRSVDVTNYPEMAELERGGNVDLFNRPKVDTKELKKAGWQDAGDGTATVFSGTYTNAKGNKAANFTPIVTDKNGKYVRTLSEDELTDYAESVLDGRRKDDLKLQIGKSHSSIDDAVNAAERVHKLQEEYYLNPRKSKAENNAKSIAKIAKQLGITEDEVRQRMNAPKEELNAYDESKINKEQTEKMQAYAKEEKRKGAQKKQNVWDAFTGRMSKAMTDVVNAPVAIAGKIAGKDWSIYNDAQKEEFRNAKEQHPTASAIGDFAGMALAAATLGGGTSGMSPAGAKAGDVMSAIRDEAILNGATKGQALMYGLKGAIPTLAANAASNMPTDFAVDVIPTLANDIAEGEKTDNEIIRDTILNTGINYGFNAIGDAISLGKAVKNAGNPVSGVDDVAKQIPGLNASENVPADEIARLNTNPLEADNKQFAELMNTYNSQFKDDSAMKNIFTPEDLDASQNRQLSTLMDEYRMNNDAGDFAKQMPGGKTVEQIEVEKANIAEQLRKYANGELSQKDLINLGITPEYLQELGDVTNPMVMNQGAISKIAYPPGYMGGKHNLGYDAISEIPNRLNDPAAVMKSLTQPNSGVVLTDMFDASGKPVIAPIHMDKMKDENIVNELASMYGKGNIEKMLENSDIIYKNEEKVRDVLSGNGLQLSKQKATTDPFLNYNVANNVQNVNKNSVNFELPQETFDKLDSHFEELARPLNEVQNSGIMNSVTDEKALTEWANVNEAYSDYLNKAMFGESVEEVEAAKKTLDNARKRYARAMKDIAPEVSKAFDSGSLGYQIGRPLNERTVKAVSEQGQEAVDAINELENLGNTKKAGTEPLQFFADGKGGNTSEWKTSQLRTNTLENTGKINVPEDLPEKDFAYRVFKEVEQKAQAINRYKDSKDIATDLMNLDQFDEVDVKAAMDEWKRLMDAGDQKSLRKAKFLSLKLSKETREGGRIVQALAEYSRNTPEGQLKGAQQAIDKIVDKKVGKGVSETLDNVAEKIYKAYENSNGDVEAFKKELDDILSGDLRKHAGSKTAKKMKAKAIKGKDKVLKMVANGDSIDNIIDQVYKDNGGVKLTSEEQKKIYDYLTEAYKLPEGSYEQEELLSKAARLAVGRAPSTVGQKIRSVLYSNMLGNFKTALSRNAFGNLGYQTLEQARQPITAAVDWATSKVTRKHSALGWNKGKAKAYVGGFKQGAAEQLKDIAKHIDTGRSGAKGWEEALANNATTFNDSNAVGKLANDVEYYVRNAMELGDRPFYEANYKQNFVELQQLIDRYGKENVAGLSGIKEEDLPEVMDMIASVRAADSVFQKHGKMSKGLTDLRNGLGEMSEGVVGVDILSTAASPFTMTPGNMIQRAIEYTPLGFVKNAVETIKEVGGKKGFNQRRFVDEASRSITGLPILAATYGMAKKGQINGGYSTDPDERAAQQEDGFIEYGYNVPKNVPYYGGKTLDTSDIPVIGPFMQAGAVMAEEGISPKSSLQAAEAVLGGSTTQGIRRAFGADTGSYSSQDSVIDNLANTVLSSGSQLIPSLARQTAQTIDPYKRDLGEYGTAEYYLNLMKNSDPIGRKTLPIKTNVEGKPVLQNQGRSMPEKILENYILPMNVSEYKPSKLNKEASRLLDTTGEASGFAPNALRKDIRAWDEADGKTYSEKQFREYKKDLGQLNSSIGNTMLDSREYKNFTDKEKAKALGDAYTAMKQVARYNATGNMGDNKLAKIYKEAGGGKKGSKAVVKEVEIKTMLRRYDVTDSAGSRAVYDDFGENGLKQYSRIKDRLGDSSKGEDIEKAINSIPSLSKESKAKYYSYLDTDTTPGHNPFGYVAGVNYNSDKDDKYQAAKSLIPSLSPENYYKNKASIDTDGNGNIKEAEILDYINANAKNDEEANTMWTAYHGESENKKGQIKKVVKKGGKYIATY